MGMEIRNGDDIGFLGFVGLLVDWLTGTSFLFQPSNKTLEYSHQLRCSTLNQTKPISVHQNLYKCTA